MLLWSLNSHKSQDPIFANQIETTFGRKFQIAFGQMCLSLNSSKHPYRIWLSMTSLYVSTLRHCMRHTGLFELLLLADITGGNGGRRKHQSMDRGWNHTLNLWGDGSVQAKLEGLLLLSQLLHCPTYMLCKVFVLHRSHCVHRLVLLTKHQNRPLTTVSHLTANLKARFAELLVIFPGFGILRIQESGKSVRALGDTELEEETHPLNEKAHQSCIIKHGGEVGEEHKSL